MPVPVAQVQAVFQQFSAGFSKRDADAVMSLFVHDDSVFVFDVVGPPRQYVGWDAYLKDLQHFFAALKAPLHHSVKDLSITISGDVAYTHSIQEVRGEFTNGTPYRADVRVTDVLRRLDDKWLFVQEHISVPVDSKTVMRSTDLYSL
ncbi:MAG: nuclear transport factor 2 family protein [Candidatus Eremiobacteraeota bacterium]|nr:nuclear transport factor 2 family protein [Candidatus Eremiobacteraeota bacterium]